ncbi:Aste57867_12713 [Aphanomyces stellatus]|uniref:Aste57867_12713 protein n=1 Tax=Aphanomyces stellatus TaxID=120398 RepID=A0A485KWA3_9STRA|nr:hypothetical protein As57867_012665 [Aphanomyces stellatus]VFT89563.1 Aste57867_12713 [Aphanomyces stellatus]
MEQPPARRYRLEPTLNGGVDITVPYKRAPYQFALACIILVIAALLLDQFATLAATGADVLLVLVMGVLVALILFCGFCILRAFVGVERISITPATLSYEWQVLCFGSPAKEEYTLDAMGPLEPFVKTGRFDGVDTTETNLLLRFRYGSSSVCVGYYLEEVQVQALLNDLTPYLPGRLVATPQLSSLQFPRDAVSSSSPPRFQVQHAPDGTLHVAMPNHIHPALLCFLVVFDALFIVFSGLNLTSPSMFATREDGIQEIVWGVAFGIAVTALSCAILRALFGIERCIVSSTTWTYERRVLCVGLTKHYDVQLMGPLQLTTETFVLYETRRTDSPSRVVSQHLFGFQYGGAMVNMGYYLAEGEVESFLDAIVPFMPAHLAKFRPTSIHGPDVEAQEGVVASNNPKAPLTAIVYPSYS